MNLYFFGVTTRVAPFVSIFFASQKWRIKKGFPLQSLTQLDLRLTTFDLPVDLRF